MRKVTNRMVFRKWLFGKNIGRYLEVAGLCGGDECFEVDYAGSAHQHEEAPAPNKGKLTRTQESLDFRR